MISILYGNNLLRINDKTKEFQNNGYANFYGDLETLKNTCFNSSLFENKNQSLIVDLLLNNIQLEDLYSYLERFSKSTYNLVFIFSKNTITKKYLDFFDKKEKYTLSKNNDIFKFLDNLFMGNTKLALRYYYKIIKNTDEIYFISMIFFNLKNMLLYFYNKDQFSKINPYVQSKTSNICSKSYFNKAYLKDLLYALSEADYKVKSGSDSLSVLTGLIMFIIYRAK
ncbi:hypothetical protein COV24_04010 [candidate division WWE3 bacterium CG10_big_fil_rev_8_21_14_0_10_32_10]|uniref:DNA polymerase III delta subunit-like C-terminal domain-containing protein n=1 Tax=candidate division WWE3 bacterium CG10_big_fil_rev_8_21_14_0_10_32_10 TaxID=1975090 RepID=A0A2H0R9H6_UNCKA|nr:MAG: hypothetical protein COV24_04010 [candidate division WWE3 bacterium CG10_big_fil_rev_8_21_14_0_10_32_10]